MEEFNSLRSDSPIFKLKDLKPGKYKLISLRKIKTKYGDSVVVKITVELNEVKEYFLKKKHGELSDKAIQEINEGGYVFYYEGLIDGKYIYTLI